MKYFLKVLLLLLMLSPMKAQAVTFNVLVLPADILNVCNNYYCHDEASNIFAQSVIDNFSNSSSITTIPLDAVRAKVSSNQSVKSLTLNTLRKYNRAGNIDMQAVKQISDVFGVKSVLLISSAAMTKNSNLRRSVWEVLDLSSQFDIVYPYELETSAVLIDTVNGLVMWSGNYRKKLGNNNNEFKAKTPSEAALKLEQMEMYAKAIVGRNIAQNITLRFFPKSSNPVISPKSTENASPSTFFRKAPPTYDMLKSREIKGENESDFGEIIYGL